MSKRAPAHEALRAATRANHDRVDALFGCFDIARLEDYRRFLRAHATAFLAVETALDAIGLERLVDDWPERRRNALIRADLESLGEIPPEPAAFPIASDAAAIGAAYVLEGSRLGGALLARRVGDGLPKEYLATPLPAGAWRKFLEELDSALDEPAMVADAAEAARAVFDRFEAAGREEKGDQ